MSVLKVDYSKTVIYKIVCKDPSISDCYVGSTINFTNRKQNHKNYSKSSNIQLYKFIRDHSGWENFSMIEIEKYSCNDGNEARARERYYYDLLNANLNKQKPLITKEELKRNEKERKQKEQYKQNQKKYRDELSEECKNENKVRDKNRKQTEYYKNYIQSEYYKNYIKEYRIKYRNENKDIINAKRREKIICSCGNVISRASKSNHIKSLLHISKSQSDIKQFQV